MHNDMRDGTPDGMHDDRVVDNESEAKAEEDSGTMPSLGFASASTYREYQCANPAASVLLRARALEVRLDVADQFFFAAFARPVTMVVVADPTNPLSVVQLPIVARIARLLPRCDFWVMEPEKGLDLIQSAIPDGGPGGEPAAGRMEPDLPCVLVLDENRRFAGEWGPYPAGFGDELAAWVERHPEDGACVEGGGALGLTGPYASAAYRLLHDMRIWYNSGLTAVCVAEVRSLLQSTLGDEGLESDNESEGADA